jgi:hypothetical protein
VLEGLLAPRAPSALRASFSPHASHEVRAEALAAAGRAVALAPEDPEAMALLVKLLTTPPGHTPPEVTRAVEEAARATRRRLIARGGKLFAVGWTVCMPLYLALSRDWRLFALIQASGVVAAVALYVAHRRDDTAPTDFPYSLVACLVALMMTGLNHGPLLAAPAILVGLAATVLAGTNIRRRGWFVVVALASVVVPIVIAWLDLHPVRHVFDEGASAMTIVAGPTAMPRHATFALFALLYGTTMLATCRFASQHRDALSAAELKNRLYMWQLGQLVPKLSPPRDESSAVGEIGAEARNPL